MTRKSVSGRAQPTQHQRLIAMAALAAAAAVLTYLPALSNGFVWDDPVALRQLQAFRTWTDLVVMPPEVPRYYYRPLVYVSYLIDRSLAGEQPFWFHASVVAWHALNGILVLFLATRCLPNDRFIPIGAAILFAVWPTHVESVAWMAGRSDVIVATWLLSTTLLYGRRDWPWAPWIGGATFFLALLSKEVALAGLMIVPAFEWLQGHRLRAARYVPLALATLAYFALRGLSAGDYVATNAGGVALAERVPELMRATGFYLVRSVVPVGLSPYIPTIPQSPGYLLAGVLAVGASLAVAFRTWPWSRWPLAFLLLWFLATLFPSLVVIVRTSASTPVADRYLYVPSVASCILITWGVASLVRWRRWPIGLFVATGAVVSLALAGYAADYSRVWRDNHTFWSTVAGEQPDSGMAQREFGAVLLAGGDLGRAEAAFERALDLPQDPTGEAMTYSNLGLVYRRTGRFSDSVVAIESALRLGPHPALYHNLGMTLMAKAEADQKAGNKAAVAQNVQDARRALRKAFDPLIAGRQESALEQWDPAKTHLLLGQVLYSLGDRPGARREFEATIRLTPPGPIADSARRWLARVP